MSRRIGVISDTHGLLRPQVKPALAGVELIIHAGDVGSPDVLNALRGVARVVAIRGNVDHGPWAQGLPTTEVVEVDGRLLYVLHDLWARDLDPVAAGFQVVISGHSHQPLIRREAGVLYVNPGSAGPKRFSLPISLAILTIDADGIDARVVELEGG